MKIGLGLAKKGGIGGGGVLCTWQLAWLALAGPFLSILTQTGIDKAPLPFFFFRRSIHWSEALTIVSSLMSGRGRGYEP